MKYRFDLGDGWYFVQHSKQDWIQMVFIRARQVVALEGINKKLIEKIDHKGKIFFANKYLAAWKNNPISNQKDYLAEQIAGGLNLQELLVKKYPLIGPRLQSDNDIYLLDI